MRKVIFSLVICFSTGAVAQSEKSMLVDLNADGKKDRVLLEPYKDCHYRLQVNGVYAKQTLLEYACQQTTLKIVDLDQSDAYKQISVETIGDSDIGEQVIYWFDGKRIKEILRRNTQDEGLVILENGIIHRTNTLKFPPTIDKYVYNKKKHEFELVTQPFHYVGLVTKTGFSFPIYLEAKRNAKRVARVKPNTEIQLLVVNQSKWYLVKTSSNLVGWASHRDVDKVFAEQKREFEYRP